LTPAFQLTTSVLLLAARDRRRLRVRQGRKSLCN